MRTVVIATSVVCLVVLGTAPYAAAQQKDAEAYIRAAGPRFAAAFNRGDWKTVSEHYTEDAVVLAPEADMVRGPEKIRELFASFAPMNPQLTITADRIVQSRDVAYEYGTYTMKMTPPGAKAVVDRGKYLTVWRRTPSGWKIAADMFNTSMKEEAHVTENPQGAVARLRRLLGIINSLNRIEKELIHRYSKNPQAFAGVRAQVAPRIAHLRSVLGLSGCEEDFCEVNGICEPCGQQPGSAALSAAPLPASTDPTGLQGMLYSLDGAENQVTYLYSSDAANYSQVETAVIADTSQMMQVLGINDCEVDYCMKNGICEWCSSSTFNVW